MNTPVFLAAAVLALAAHGHAVAQSADCGGEDLAVQVLQRVNALRAEPRVCGVGRGARGARLPSVPPLEWHGQLAQAAQAQAQDMAGRGVLSHSGADGSNAGQRLAATGYTASAWAENVARGALDLDGAMAGWRASPPHCRNLMQAPVQHVAAACAQPQHNGPRYWVLLVAAPL